MRGDVRAAGERAGGADQMLLKSTGVGVGRGLVFRQPQKAWSPPPLPRLMSPSRSRIRPPAARFVILAHRRVRRYHGPMEIAGTLSKAEWASGLRPRRANANVDAIARSGILSSFVPAGSAARPPAGLFFCGFRGD